MAPTVRRTMGNSAMALVLAGAAAGTYVAWKRFGTVDPYQGVERSRTPDPNAVVQAKDVEIRQYHDGKPTASAQAKGIVIGQDRGVIKLNGIKNGVLNAPQGKMQFAAGQGVLRPTQKSIDVMGGVRVKGKEGADFDIQSERASINGRIGEVTVPTPMQGTIMGGKFTADRLVRKMNADRTEILHPTWIGRPSAVAGAPKQIKDRTWTFTGDEVVQEKGVDTATNGWASDGKMVITAPHIVQVAKTKVVTATKEGDVRATYHSAKADIVADKVVIYRDEQRAVCTGHVLVYVRPKSEWDKPLKVDPNDRGMLVPDIPAPTLAKIGQGEALTAAEKKRIDDLRSGGNLRDYPMQMAAEEVTYWYKEGERRAIAKGGNPTAFQKFDDGHWRQVWAPEAHYDGEKELMDLIGSDAKREIRYRNSIDDVTDSFYAQFSTKEDQKEGEEYVRSRKPLGHAIDFDDDKKSSGGTKPPAGGKPATGPTAPPAVKPKE